MNLNGEKAARIFFRIWPAYSNIGLKETGGVQNVEWSNIERPIFRNFKTTNIEIAKHELFDYFIYEFIFYYFFLNYSTLKVFDHFVKL